MGESAKEGKKPNREKEKARNPEKVFGWFYSDFRPSDFPAFVLSLLSRFRD